MNNKKKIIRTLRKADKASVEKLLAEEKKKNEIFEKAQRKANIIEEDYTDAVKGVEKYERRINMTRIASIAAAIAVIIGAIGGGHFIKKNKQQIPQVELHEVTTSSDTSTPGGAVTTVTGKKSGGTFTTTVTAVTETTAAETSITTVSQTEAVSENPTETTAVQTEDSLKAEVFAAIEEHSQIGDATAPIYETYVEIIREYGEMIKAQDTSGRKYGDDISTELIIAGNSYENLNVGYAFYDVNEDGVQELLIGVNYDNGSGPAFDSTIYNIYTVNSNNEVVLLASGGARNRYYICTNTTADRLKDQMQHGAFIGNEGTGSATVTFSSFYRVSLQTGSLRLIDCVFTDGLDENNELITYYTNEEPFTDKSTMISQDEAQKIIEGYRHYDIRFIPFK